MSPRTRFVVGLLVLSLCLASIPLKEGYGEAETLHQPQGTKIHPVILVHGLGSAAEMWEGAGTVYHTLLADGYAKDFILLFAYPPGRGQEDGYGDIKLIAQELAQEIDRLSQASVQAGGPSEVDVVVHSLGGLITRQYLRQHLADHKIRKFIDIATPHRGTLLMSAYNKSMDGLADGLTDTPVGNWIARQLIDLVVHAAFEKLDPGFVPDPTTPACQQLDPDSEFLRELNRVGQSPMDVDYAMLYGDVSMKYQWDVFGIHVVSKEVASLGDLLVARDNAGTVPGLGTREGPNPSNYQTYGFVLPMTLRVSLQFDSWQMSAPNLSSTLKQVKKVWHSGLTHNPEVNQRILTILNEGFVEPVPGSGLPTSAATSATALVIDVSGSMEETWRGGVKVKSAQNAAGDVINMIEQESRIGESNHQVAIASFASTANLDLALTSDYDAARSAVQGLRTWGRTNIGEALQIANQALSSAPADAQKIIILLSDGQTNEGLAPQSILDGSVQEAADAGTCIYTVGFGDSGDLDEYLLEQMPKRAGCGAYTYASAPAELERAYVRLRHQSLGQVIGEFEGQIAQGETVELGQVEVPANQGELYVSLHWPGSTLDLIVTDPAGRQVDENTPGVSLTRYQRLVYLIVQDPLTGMWRLRASGVDVPEGTLTYDAIASVRERVGTPPGSQDNSWLIALLLVLVVGGGGVTLIYMTRSPGPRQAQAGLQILQGQAARPFVGLRQRQLTIGRDSRCGLRLHDPKVSARHAMVQRTPAGYVLTDLGSTNGTYVDGQRVQQITLYGGERLRIGQAELLFTAGERRAAHPTAQTFATLAVMIGQQEHGRYKVPAGAVLGGHSASPIPLSADAQVSRQHARLDYQAGQWLITDLNSTNGIYVNGQQVRQQVLRAGDEIHMGNTVLRFYGG